MLNRGEGLGACFTDKAAAKLPTGVPELDDRVPQPRQCQPRPFLKPEGPFTLDEKGMLVGCGGGVHFSS